MRQCMAGKEVSVYNSYSSCQSDCLCHDCIYSGDIERPKECISDGCRECEGIRAMYLAAENKVRKANWLTWDLLGYISKEEGCKHFKEREETEMNFDNLYDVISWCKENAKPPKGYDILDIKIRNLGEGFRVTIAFQLTSDIVAPLVVQMYVVNSYGKIIDFKETCVNDWVK